MHYLFLLSLINSTHYPIISNPPASILASSPHADLLSAGVFLLTAVMTKVERGLISSCCSHSLSHYCSKTYRGKPSSLPPSLSLTVSLLLWQPPTHKAIVSLCMPDSQSTPSSLSAVRWSHRTFHTKRKRQTQTPQVTAYFFLILGLAISY